MAICKQCSVFQELSEPTFSEALNNKSSNIISNSFVNYKPEDNKEFVATVNKVNKNSIETCKRHNKIQSDLKYKNNLL